MKYTDHIYLIASIDFSDLRKSRKYHKVNSIKKRIEKEFGVKAFAGNCYRIITREALFGEYVTRVSEIVGENVKILVSQQPVTREFQEKYAVWNINNKKEQ